MKQDSIAISISREIVLIDRQVYQLLFEQSIVHDLIEYKRTLSSKAIPFSDLVSLARKAGIPYSLLFAPLEFVQKQMKRKDSIILSGVTKKIFSMNSRGVVQLKDIELIVRDLIRKQMLLKKHDASIPANIILGSLVRSRKSVEHQARLLRGLIGINLDKVALLNKEKTFDYIVSLLEERNVFVSESSRTYMPQNVQNSVTFSGICIKDSKTPFIFLNNRDDGKNYEPEGRKILTLVLLTVCLARSKFSPVSYNSESRDLIKDTEYQIAEEILIPREKVIGQKLSSLDDIRRISGVFSVTPSAFLMRAYRLNLIRKNDVIEYRRILQEQFSRLPKNTKRTPKPPKGFRKYNGRECSRRIFDFLDKGFINRTDVRRILFFNKKGISFVDEFRQHL